jgi:hypothetical protein
MRLRGRRETNLLPPFRGCDEANAAVKQMRLLVGDTSLEPGSTFRDARSLLRIVQVVLETHLDEATSTSIADAAGIPVAALSLVVTARASFLKWEDVIVQEPLAVPSTTLTLSAPPRPRALRAMHTGFDIAASIVVAENQPIAAGIAWQSGTVLASTTFKVRPLADFGFQPEPLDDDVRKAYGIPPGASRYLLFHDGGPDPWEATTMDEVLTAYVDESVLILMGGTSVVRKETQAELAAAVYASVFQRCAAAGTDIPDDIDDSLLAELCSRVDAGSKATPGKVLGLLRGGNAELAIAHVDAMVGLQVALVTILKGADPNGI